VDPSGRFLYVTLLNDSNGSIFAYTINSANGALSPVPGSPFATVANGQPQFLAVHPSGKFLYAGLDGPSAVAAFAIRANGALAPVAGSPFPTGNFPLGLAVDRAGRFLYTADTGAGTISAFAVDQNSGALSALSGSPFSAGTNSAGLARSPYAMVTDTTSKFLYVSDGSNSAMLTFNISATGALSGPSVTTSGGDPLYLTLVSVP
jgi:6-phosphogluconolactonase (cycloisomerase 2 family)